jgi:hypothetical protein
MVDVDGDPHLADCPRVSDRSLDCGCGSTTKKTKAKGKTNVAREALRIVRRMDDDEFDALVAALGALEVETPGVARVVALVRAMSPEDRKTFDEGVDEHGCTRCGAVYTDEDGPDSHDCPEDDDLEDEDGDLDESSDEDEDGDEEAESEEPAS